MEKLAEHYLEQASACRRMAEAAKDPERREQWLDVANGWSLLARYARRK
jgi:hypothetical protein